MKKQNAASLSREKRHISKKTCNPILQDSAKKKQYQNSEKSNKPKRYPCSDGSINLPKPCPYCNYERGLKIIRFKNDKGFCKCARCDAALFSIAEAKEKSQGLTHIGKILDDYLPSKSNFDGEMES